MTSCPPTLPIHSCAGVITLGMWTNYTPDSECSWIIEAPEGLPHITLTATAFETEKLYDVLYVYDSNGLLAAFSGSGTDSFPAAGVSTSSGFMWGNGTAVSWGSYVVIVCGEEGDDMSGNVAGEVWRPRRWQYVQGL